MAKFTVKAYAVYSVEIEADTAEEALEQYDSLGIFGELYALNIETAEQQTLEWFCSDAMGETVHNEQGEEVDSRW